MEKPGGSVTKEKFGKFVLCAATEESGFGQEFRAAKLGATGLEKIVSVLRLAPAISGHAEVAKTLMDQAKFAAQLQSPNIVKILGIGKVDATYYISSEFIEGKSLRAVFARCRQDGFPFSVDHTLLIASKICSALEYAHSRKTDGGVRYFHGLLTPASVVVSYEGEVRARGFGFWPSRVRDSGTLAPEDRLYLAPEQDAGGVGDTRSDTFAVGAILFETLTGQPLFQEGRAQDPVARLATARLQSPGSDEDSLPKPIVEILKRALAADPAGRYAEIQEMRKAIDILLFSGDFTPTTFNLAFFMHSLFREDIERESKLLKEEREASYAEYLADETRTRPGASPAPTGTIPESVTLPGVRLDLPPAVAAAKPSRQEHAARPAPSAAATQHTPAPGTIHAPLPAPPRAPSPAPHPAPAPPAHQTPAATLYDLPHDDDQTLPSQSPLSDAAGPGLPPKEAAAGFTFHKEEGKRRTPLFVGMALLALIAAAGGYYLMKSGVMAPAAPPPAPPVTLSAEAQAAMLRVQELEQKLAALEAEKKAAEEKAAEDARRKVEAQAKARGQAVDPEALARAQEDEKRKARAEQEARQQEEQRKLEEAKKAEEARLAEERRKAEELRVAEEAARLAAAPTTLPPPTTLPAPTPTPEPALKPGTLLNLTDPGVIAPITERKPTLSYPPLALRQRVEGTVELSVLVDETGKVTDAQVSGAGGRMGLNEAAVDYVRKWKFRPATKDGVPVKVWVPVKIDFRLPR
jgi:TonB family protein